jgi:hypothetical protein
MGMAVFPASSGSGPMRQMPAIGITIMFPAAFNRKYDSNASSLFWL